MALIGHGGHSHGKQSFVLYWVFSWRCGVLGVDFCVAFFTMQFAKLAAKNMLLCFVQILNLIFLNYQHRERFHVDLFYAIGL